MRTETAPLTLLHCAQPNRPQYAGYQSPIGSLPGRPIKMTKGGGNSAKEGEEVRLVDGKQRRSAVPYSQRRAHLLVRVESNLVWDGRLRKWRSRSIGAD